MAGIGLDRPTLAMIIGGKITTESLSQAAISQIAMAVAAAIDENNMAIDQALGKERRQRS